MQATKKAKQSKAKKTQIKSVDATVNESIKTMCMSSEIGHWRDVSFKSRKLAVYEWYEAPK